MIIYPIQSWGLGDVIWEQTLVKKIADGNPIIWPVEPQFVGALNRAYPDVLFIPRSLDELKRTRMEDYIEDGIRYLPLRWTDSLLKVPFSQCMASKYMFYGMDYHIWKTHAMWHRDTEKEEKLFNLLGCGQGPYAFVNCIFGSENQLKVQIPPMEGLDVVEMRPIAGFSMFDWAAVLERADAIHTVSTSNLYMLEMLELKAPEIHIYVRKPNERDLTTVDYIFEKHKYIQHL